MEKGKIKIKGTIHYKRNRIITSVILIILSIIPHLIYNTYGKVLELQVVELWFYFALYFMILFVNDKIVKLHDNEKIVYMAIFICFVANREHISYVCMDLYIIILVKYLLLKIKYTKSFYQYILSFLAALLIATKEYHFWVCFGISLTFCIFMATLETIFVKILLPLQNQSKKDKIIAILKGKVLEEEIEDFCIKIGLPKLSETIYLFLNNTLDETANILDVENSTITRRINRFIEKCTNAV